MRMEVWLWCRCECWVLMNGSSEQITHQCYGNTTMGIWTTNRECFILILSRSPVWSDCWTTIGHFLSGESGALSCVQCPPGAGPLQHLSQDQINSEMRQRRHYNHTIQSVGTNLKLDKRMPLGESCLSQEASLVTFRSESIMIPE